MPSTQRNRDLVCIQQRLAPPVNVITTSLHRNRRPVQLLRRTALAANHSQVPTTSTPSSAHSARHLVHRPPHVNLAHVLAVLELYRRQRGTRRQQSTERVRVHRHAAEEHGLAAEEGAGAGAGVSARDIGHRVVSAAAHTGMLRWQGVGREGTRRRRRRRYCRRKWRATTWIG
jgi:hypothetical protein